MDLIGKFTARNAKKSKIEKTVRFETSPEVVEIAPYTDDLKPILWHNPNLLRESLDSDIEENRKRDACKISSTSATAISPDTADDYTWRGLEHVLKGEQKSDISSRQVHMVVSIYQEHKSENATVSKSAIKYLAKAYSKEDRLRGIALAKQDRKEVEQMLRDSKLSDVSTKDSRRRRFLPFS